MVMRTLYYLSMFAVAAMAAFSCTKELKDNNKPEKDFEPKVISAFTDDDVKSDTKTSLSGVSVLWATTDNIKGWDGSAVHTSTSTAVSEGNKKAEFTFDGVSVETNLFTLAYPAEKISNIDDDFVYATIPSVQTATANSFANQANVAVADGLTTTPVFKNVGGLLSFTINNDNIRSVTLSANENLTGASQISLASASFAEATITSGKKFVTLEGTISNGTEYYAVVYPGTYTGLTIEVTDASGRVAKYTNSNPLTVARNGNLHVATLTISNEKWEDIEKGVEYVMTPDSGVWANWATYNLNDMAWTPVLVSGNENPAPGNYYTGKGYQFGTGSKGIVNMTLTGTGYTQKSKTQSGNAKAFGITDITVSLAAKKNLVYTVTATVGGVTVESSKNATGNGDTPVEVSFHSDTKLAGDIVITYAFSGDAENAGYLCINTVTINPDNRTAVTLSFDNDVVDILNTNYQSFHGQNVTVSPNESAITSNINWSYVNTDGVIGDFNDGALTLTGTAGTATVTASFDGDVNYRPAEKSYTINVVAPYTASEAYAAATTTEVSGVYVKGIVSEITTAYSPSNHNVSFTISDNGLTTGNQFTAFRTTATSADDVLVGDCVVLNGTLIKYDNTTPELKQGNTIVSSLRMPTFATGDENFETSTSVTLSAVAGATIYYTTDGTTPTTGSSVYSSAIVVSSTTTIKAIAAKDGMVTGVASKSFTKASAYAITWSTPSNGSITVKHGDDVLSNGDAILTGETITIIATPESGYALSSLVYSDGVEDHDIKATKSFIMPESAVSITATFALSGSVPAVNTVLFSDTFDTALDGTSASVYYSTTGTTAAYNSVTYGATITYARSNSSNVTVDNNNGAGGDAKEILINKNGGSLTISGIKTYGATRVRVSFKYKCNKATAPITATCGSTNSGDFTSTSADTASFDAVVSGDTFDLVIRKTAAANSTAARFDDITITVLE